MIKERVQDVKNGHFVTIRGVRLDSLAHYVQKPSQDVIMELDVEESELDALKGATRILPRVRMLAVEVHEVQLAEEVKQFLDNFCLQTELVTFRGTGELT